MRVGYYFPEKKLKKQGIHEFLVYAKQALPVTFLFENQTLEHLLFFFFSLQLPWSPDDST